MNQAFLFVFALLFFAGFAENFIDGWQTRAVAHGHPFHAFFSGAAYVVVWYVALRAIVENLSTIWVALGYALGSGIGSLCVVLFYSHRKRRPVERGSDAK